MTAQLVQFRNRKLAVYDVGGRKRVPAHGIEGRRPQCRELARQAYDVRLEISALIRAMLDAYSNVDALCRRLDGE